MLRPVSGPHRLALDQSGFWNFKADPNDVGPNSEDGVGAEEWFLGMAETDQVLALPGTWNEQLSEQGLADYVGAAWLSREVFVPVSMEEQRIFLRVGSADYQVQVWVNGANCGTSTAAFLPFDVEITEHVTPGRKAMVVLRVDNRADADSIPQGIASHEFAEPKERGARAEHYPPARYDFFPYGGVHRPVVLYSLAPAFIEDVHVTTALGDAGSATVSVEMQVAGPAAFVEATLIGEGVMLAEEVAVEEGRARVRFDLAAPRLWGPADPYLYALSLSLIDAARGECDAYTLPVGVREVRVAGTKLLLNGEPVFLRGFGKHEDFAVLGKAVSLPLVVKDFELLAWTGANSFRTSHYPYAEDWLDEADRRGVLVIDEVPAVSLNHSKTTDATQAAHREAIRALIARDKNHPSVIAWAIGNEPGLSGEPESGEPIAHAYWAPLFDETRRHDPTRPVTVPTHGPHPGKVLYPLCDFVSLNRYYGWYSEPGQLDRGLARLEAELDDIAEAHGKPIMLTEFGADTVAGLHATTMVQFTEEFQAELICRYVRAIAAHPSGCGAHVWNFADFRTPQNYRRVVLNLKGVFTRDRQPKRAAFVLRDLWHDLSALARPQF
ncbi:MAG: beta-glucuronidase [Bacteroidota bacterium]